jgi:hypothetical protein
MLFENFRDAQAGTLFNQLVCINELATQFFGDQFSNGGFSHPHKAS